MSNYIRRVCQPFEISWCRFERVCRASPFHHLTEREHILFHRISLRKATCFHIRLSNWRCFRVLNMVRAALPSAALRKYSFNIRALHVTRDPLVSWPDRTVCFRSETHTLAREWLLRLQLDGLHLQQTGRLVSLELETFP